MMELANWRRLTVCTAVSLFLSGNVGASAQKELSAHEFKKMEAELVAQIQAAPSITAKADGLKELAWLHGYVHDWDGEIDTWIRFVQLFSKESRNTNERLLNFSIGFLCIGRAYRSKAVVNPREFVAAEHNMRRAVALARELAERHPGGEAENRLLISRFTLADCLLDQGKKQQAIAIYQQIRNSSAPNKDSYLLTLDLKIRDPGWPRPASK